MTTTRYEGEILRAHVIADEDGVYVITEEHPTEPGDLVDAKARLWISGMLDQVFSHPPTTKRVNKAYLAHLDRVARKNERKAKREAALAARTWTHSAEAKAKISERVKASWAAKKSAKKAKLAE